MDRFDDGAPAFVGDGLSSVGGHTFCPPRNRPFVLVAAILASSMGFIDGSVVSLAVPAIRADIGASLAEAQWVSNAYMLFLSSLVLIGGAAGDVFGVRAIFEAGIGFFMATSLACALVTTPEMLIVMRAAQGIGAALMVPGSLAIIAKAYPAESRGRAIGTWAAFSSLTTAAGPLVGGALLTFGDAWMWRTIFAINVPIGLAALAMLYLRVPRDRPSGQRSLDLPGAALATASLGTLAWGLTAFGVPEADRLLPPAAWLGLGALLFGLFIAWERRAREPMVKLGLLVSRAFAGANVYTLLLFIAFSAILFFLPMTLISAWGMSAWQVALLLSPLSLAIALMSRSAGRLADRIGPRLPLTAGAAMVGAAYAGMAVTMPLMLPWAVLLPLVILKSVGMAAVVSPLSSAVMLATADEDTGLASGLNNAVARAGGLIAVAALGAVAGLVFGTGFEAVPTGVEFGAVPEIPLADALEGMRIGASNRAFAAVAALSALMSLLAAAVAWFTQPSERGILRPSGGACVNRETTSP